MQRNFLKKKFGSVELWEIIMLIFGSLLVVVLVKVFFFDLPSALFSQKDDGSITNFDSKIYTSLKELMQTNSDGYKIQNYFIGRKRILIGFDSNWDDNRQVIEGNFLQKSGIGIFGKNNVFKPFKCGTSACLCLYTTSIEKGESNKRDAGVLECRSEIFSGKDVVFISEGSTANPKTAGVKRDDAEGNYLFLYGEQWQVQRIYIEKRYDGKRNYIYISKIDESNMEEPANRRKLLIDSQKQKPKGIA